MIDLWRVLSNVVDLLTFKVSVVSSTLVLEVSTN